VHIDQKVVDVKV